MVIFHQSATRVRPGTRTDRGGNQVPDWSPGAVSRLVLDRLSVQPSVQTEQVGDMRTEVVTGWHVLTEPGTDADVLSGDRIEYGGITCEVRGEVARWPDPLDGSVHHVEWQMTRATG